MLSVFKKRDFGFMESLPFCFKALFFFIPEIPVISTRTQKLVLLLGLLSQQKAITAPSVTVKHRGGSKRRTEFPNDPSCHAVLTPAAVAKRSKTNPWTPK